VSSERHAALFLGGALLSRAFAAAADTRDGDWRTSGRAHRRPGRAFGGYRYLSAEFRDRIVFDVTVEGPGIGFTWTW
jgi:hypothetical protein